MTLEKNKTFLLIPVRDTVNESDEETGRFLEERNREFEDVFMARVLKHLSFF